MQVLIRLEVAAGMQSATMQDGCEQPNKPCAILVDDGDVGLQSSPSVTQCVHISLVIECELQSLLDVNDEVSCFW